MLRTLATAVAVLYVAIVATPASAVTSEEKMETCKVGAESQQLQGAKRDAFIKKNVKRVKLGETQTASAVRARRALSSSTRSRYRRSTSSTRISPRSSC